MKSKFKLLVPPIFLNFLRKLNPSSIKYYGQFREWNDAEKKCTGYDNEKIFNIVKTASLKVRNGEACCERDSVLFDTPQYSWASLSCLMYIAAVNKGKLRVLDFGGSLGTSYFTNASFFKNLDVEWSIIEQPHFVEFGKSCISDDTLKFYENISLCNKDREINVAFLSSVLQYLKEPYDCLKQLINIEIKHILLDRMPFSKDGNGFIQIQTTPKSIYEASYPLHILSETEMINFMDVNNYFLVEKFKETTFTHTEKFYPRGLFFERKTNA